MKKVLCTVCVALCSAFAQSVVEVEGYGELYGFATHHEGTQGTARMIVAPSVRLSPSLTLLTQVGFEHPAENGKWYEGELEVLAVEGKATSHVSVSAGKIHVPVGLFNLYHEPVYFLTLEPSRVEGTVIPAEWHETAFLVSYENEEIVFTAGAMTPMDGKKLESSSWIREGKEAYTTKGGQPAWVGRVEWGKIEEVMVGGSCAFVPLVGSSAHATLAEAHVAARLENGWEVMGIASRGWIDEYESLSIINSEQIAKRSQGASLTIGYDIGQEIGFSKRKMVVFGHASYAQSATSTTTYGMGGNMNAWGVDYFLTPNVVAKAQYSQSAKEGDRVGCGIGFVY